MAEKKEVSLARHWLGEIESARKEFEKWEERALRVVRRYRDERDAVNSKVRRFNLLWSNIQVLKPALYGRMPKPEVSRRFKDADPVGRAASMMLERCLEYEVEQYPDFQRTMRCAVEDRLLPGRGTAWVRYEPNITTESQVSEDADASIEHLAYECAPTDYVHWTDFLHEPCRTWEEVTWVARRVWMTTEEGQQRFGDVFLGAPMGQEDKKDTEKTRPTKKSKAEVWEIWDKVAKQAVWIARGLDKELDVRADPLELEGFFPTPMPLYATVTTGSLIPVPDYCQYQDQAEEIDVLTQRISRLTKAVKAVGVYNAEYPAVKRLLDEGVDNVMIPVDTWAAFAEKNGLAGAMQMLSLKEVIEALGRLYEAREAAKQIVYETMGISDIVRGVSDPNETLGAQQYKTQFGSMRLKQPQEDVARFATDLLRMKAHIICKFFSEQTIVQMSGIEHTLDAQLAQQALALLKQGPIKDFRVEVNADSLAQLDEQAEKQEATEFITATGMLIEKALPLVQAFPAAAPMIGEILMFSIRKFHVGRTVEAAFDNAMQQLGSALSQPKPDDSENIKRKAEMDVQGVRQQAEKQVADMELDAKRKDLDTERKMFELTKSQQMMQMKGEIDTMGVPKAQQIMAEHQQKLAQAQGNGGPTELETLLSAIASSTQETQRSLAGLMEVLSLPRQIIRDTSGRAVGMKIVRH